MNMPQTRYVPLKGNNTAYVTVGDIMATLSVYSTGLSISVNMTHVEARALAERIINTLDNYQLSKE